MLAIAVVISHFGIWPHGISPGVVAVVSFFVISGYVTTALVEKYYADPGTFPAFLLDRAMRLFPQYLFYLFVAWVILAFLHPADPAAPVLSAKLVLGNLLMVPTDFYMLFQHPVVMNPPTWTLGLEFTFYMALPLLIRWKMRSPAFVLSFAIFLLAFTGVLDTDVYGYRLIPGTLFIFLCGSFMRPSATRTQRWLVVGAWTGTLAMLGAYMFTERFNAHYNIEMVTGILVGVPIVALLSRYRYRKADEVFGNVSYGVYLNHFPLIWIFAAMGLAPATIRMQLVVIVTSFALSWLTYTLIERPVIRARHKIRRRESAPSALQAQSAG
nr:acyltransferase [Pinirhizobacter soli]